MPLPVVPQEWAALDEMDRGKAASTVCDLALARSFGIPFQCPFAERRRTRLAERRRADSTTAQPSSQGASGER